LLDEPTAAMDAETEKFVIKILQRVKANAGIIVVSHKDSLTQIADVVYCLRDGVSQKMQHSVYSISPGAN
jgi:ABC-type transport system involved in cytochrome bd biosynthesis fused ATPase/permease subunit